MNNLTEKIDYDYLNLESMGGSPPYGFVLKSENGNYRVQKALSKSKGTILLVCNYIFSAKFTTSTTDHEVFDKQKWKGGVNVFLGKGSVYHTKYDRIEKGEEYHLKMAGNQLLDFILNYEAEGYNGNSIGYGIAPISVVLPILVMYISIPIVFIISVLAIIIKEKNNVKQFLIDLLKEFICFIIILALFLLEGYLIYLINPNSASANQIFVILTALSGLFFFLFFQRIFKIQKWSRFRLIIDSLIMVASITTDLSLPFCFLTILSILFYFFDNKIIKFIFGILQYLMMSLFFSFLIQIVMQYTTRFSEKIGNLVLFAIFFVFSYHISVSPLEFNDITEKLDIVESLSKLFSEKNENNQFVNNDVGTQYNINDELNDISDNLIDSQTKKMCDKKTIPVLLMMIYIIYPLVILIILLLKPYPYSKNYILRGTFLNVFKENSKTSSMIFLPSNGYNYAKKNIKKSAKFNNINEVKNITEIVSLDYFEKVFSYESNDNNIGIFNGKCKNIKMPENDFIHIELLQNYSNGTYEFNFNINITNDSCIDFAYIYIRCSDCVKKVNHIPIDYSKKKYASYDVLLKVGKKDIIDDYLPDFIANTNFTLSTNNFNYTIALNTMEITKEYYEFLDAFGEAACNAKSQRPADTIFVYDKSYP